MEHYLKQWLNDLENLETRILAALSIFLILFLGFLDFVTGFELSFSLFYLVPVSLVAWRSSRRSALIISAASALTWFISNRLAGESYTHPMIGNWNTLVRFGFFAVVAILLTYLKQLLEHERRLSSTDFLTNVSNSRSFYQTASTEILRSLRYKHPYTVVYIDLDNFKFINDRYGHSVGDLLLKEVADTLKTNLRNTDMVARLGGDEFALLLPETEHHSAEKALHKIRSHLLDRMEQHQWPVTFSIGAITYQSTPTSIDEILKQVDELMYSVKLNGKDNLNVVEADRNSPEENYQNLDR